MKIIDKLTLRFWFFLCLLMGKVNMWAQRDYDGDDVTPKRGADIGNIFDMNVGADYEAFHFSIVDVLLVVLLIAACYVFGKIWKGCTYILLILAGLLFYLSRY